MDSKETLARCGIAATRNRELVVLALGRAARPVTPQELLAGLDGLGTRMNRVTLYRILDLLVEHGVAARHNAGERAFRYCLRAGAPDHAHFTCTSCGTTQCLDAQSLSPGLTDYLARLPMRVDSTELRFGGVCETCLGA